MSNRASCRASLPRSIASIVVLALSLVPAAVGAAAYQEQAAQQFADLGTCVLESGESIVDCRVGYRVLGQPHTTESEVVLVPTWFGGDTAALLPFVRPGGFIDTDRYHVVLVDAFGNGVSSSPSNSATQPGAAFPHFTIRDMVRAQHRLLTEHLGIEHLAGVVGISLGGMQALEWGMTFPDFPDSVTALAAAAWAGPYDRIAWDAYLRLLDLGAAGNDEAFTLLNELEYLRGSSPAFVARTVADHEVRGVLDEMRTERFEPAQILDRPAQAHAVIAHDVRAPFNGDLAAAAAHFRPRLLVISTTSDHQVTAESSVAFANAVGGTLVLLENDCGHAGANCEAPRTLAAVARHLAGEPAAPPMTAAARSGWSSAGPASDTAATWAIRAGRLLDPSDGTVQRDQIILVDSGVVTAVGPDVAVPSGWPVIDLADATVLPGLMDAHVHLMSRVPQGRRPPSEVANTPMARRAFTGVLQARETLLAGFTTVRDIGNSGAYVDMELSRAVREGVVWGPTILTAGKIIAPYGAQTQLNPERPELGEIEYFFADTPAEMIRAVRQNVHYGADVIKIVVDDQEYIYSADDIRVIVDEAARAGRDVAAHVLTDAGARAAILGGVASLEHAWVLSDETLDLAREHDVAMVTTDFTVSAMQAYGWSDAVIAQRRALVVDRLRRALDHGVEVVFGSDLIWHSPRFDRGQWAIEQLDSFVESGATPLQILQMVTVNAARLMHLDGQRGAIAVGQAADVIAVSGNPLEDIAALKQVTFVMKDGRVAKSSAR